MTLNITTTKTQTHLVDYQKALEVEEEKVKKCNVKVLKYYKKLRHLARSERGKASQYKFNWSVGQNRFCDDVSSEICQYNATSNDRVANIISKCWSYIIRMEMILENKTRIRDLVSNPESS